MSAAVGVVGAGGWGSALALMLARQGKRVVLWVRDAARASRLARSRINDPYLPGHALPELVEVTADLKTVAEPRHLILAVPSQALRSVWERMMPWVRPDHSVVNAAKGIEIATGRRLSEVLLESGGLDRSRLAVLSGPNHAEEVAQGLPTTTVVASHDPRTAAEWQELLMAPMFRVYTSDDVIGVELGGALKNVIALACGIADGLGFGDNTKAAIITRGLAEIARLGIALGARPITFSGLSGVGDLVATCYSAHSRNSRAGRRIGQGVPVREVIDSTPMVIEGIPTCRAACLVAERVGVEMPITRAVSDVLFGGKRPGDLVWELMGRDPKSEHLDLFSKPLTGENLI